MTKVSTAPLDIEKELYGEGYHYIIGVDEAGRGAWFGEVFVAAVCLPIAVQSTRVANARERGKESRVTDDEFFSKVSKRFKGVRDSKMFTDTKTATAHEKRMKLRKKVAPQLLAGFSASASSEAIDRLGINGAESALAWVAIQKVINHITDYVIPEQPDYVIPSPENVYILCDAGIDIPEATDAGYEYRNIEKGDRHSMSIAMASIMAKTDRDNRMMDWHRMYPEYGFDAHKGYIQKGHTEKVRLHGILRHHRRSWKTTDEMIAEGAKEVE